MNPRQFGARLVRGVAQRQPRARRLAGRILRRLGLRRPGPVTAHEPPPVAAAEPEPFAGSATYWEQRYGVGGNSGRGSYGELAEFKARVVNDFIAAKGIGSVIEHGCGDGNQLSLARYPSYLGLDVSETVVALCRGKFADDPTKTFFLVDDYEGKAAELAVSLDVIYHLIEDEVFEQYMSCLFDTATRYVVVYASNTNDSSEWGPLAPHVRHRRFTDWVAANRPEWTLVDRVLAPFPYDADADTGTFADFYCYAHS